MKEIIAERWRGPAEIIAEAFVSPKPISFMGGVNVEKGTIIDEHNPLYGKSFAGKILVYPFGKGSTGDAIRLWRCCYNQVGPLAIINDDPDPIHVEGALMANIGIFFKCSQIPTQAIHTGDILHIKDGVITVESPSESK